MTEYRRVYTRIWNDKKFLALTDDAQLIFFFLMTHPTQTALGAFRGTRAGLAEEKRWPLDRFMAAFDALRGAGMVEFDDAAHLVWVVNALKYDRPESPNVIRFWSRQFHALPESQIRARIHDKIEALFKGIWRDLGKGFREAFREAFAEALPEAFREGFAESIPIPSTQNHTQKTTTTAVLRQNREASPADASFLGDLEAAQSPEGQNPAGQPTPSAHFGAGPGPEYPKPPSQPIPQTSPGEAGPSNLALATVSQGDVDLDHEMKAHIASWWLQSKGVELKFTGKQLGILKHLARLYEPEGVMALWDLWTERGTTWADWAAQTGRSLEGFAVKVPALLDEPRWKTKREKYKRQFGTDAFSLSSKLRSAGALVRSLGVV